MMIFTTKLIFLLINLPFIKSSHLNSVIITAKPINETADGDVYVKFFVNVAFTRDWAGATSM
jgi:hypothetical protein